MSSHRVYGIPFAKVYPAYIQKAERKNRTKEEVDQIIRWLTGYDHAGLQAQLEQGADLERFFAQAPAMHPNAGLIKGVIRSARTQARNSSRWKRCCWRPMVRPSLDLFAAFIGRPARA